MLLLDEPLDLANPNTTRISDAIWRLWRCFDRRVGSALLGGIYANKSGYHNYRNALSSSDYSVRNVAADRRGDGTRASAIDLTLSSSDMRLLTGRLDRAARGGDPRLYVHDGPTLREFIGTLNGVTVYCYVLTGGVPLGVGADSGPDPGRDESHLWHIHLSFIRQYLNDHYALDAILSILIGESLQSWQERMGSMALDSGELKYLAYTSRDSEALRNMTDNIDPEAVDPQVGTAPHYGVRTLKAIYATVQAIATALPGVDDAALQALAEMQAAIQATPAQVVSLLAAQPAEDAAELVVASVGDARARALAEAILAATGGTDTTE